MKLAMGALIATVLLCLYVYAVWSAILVVDCAATPLCQSHPKEGFTAGMIQTLTLIGGLVSALVIAELAVTPPGTAPMARMLEANASVTVHRSLTLLTWLYLLVWIAAGVSAYFVGQMQHPGVLQPLSDLGQSWLGLAVASGYAYFGIKPQ